VHGSKLEDADFEALAADVRREVQAMRDAPASAAQHRAVDRFAPLTLEELESARPTPRALIPGVMYCDTALLSGAGGLGKTTTMLHLAAATALGMAPFGHAAFTPAGRLRTVFLSREDTREQLAGRLARIMAEMGLSAAQRADVLAAIRIVYYGDKSFALTAPDGRGAAVNLHNVKELVAGLREFKPDLITLDPMGSWVAGDENLSADGQALVNAARALRDTFDCGVLFLAHPGKGAARAAKDMYSTRGSSAVPDGARLVMTLDKVSDKAWQRATGDALGDDETGLLFEFHKHTYSRPIAPLFVKRSAKGFGFAAVAAHPPTREDRLAEQRADQLQADAQKLHAFLTATYATGERHNRSQLEESAYAGMPRDRMRAALAELMRTGLAEAVGGQGRKGTHIKPKPADVTDEAPEGLSL
jgi:RecA-family ATPase